MSFWKPPRCNQYNKIKCVDQILTFATYLEPFQANFPSSFLRRSVKASIFLMSGQLLLHLINISCPLVPIFGDL